MPFYINHLAPDLSINLQTESRAIADAIVDSFEYAEGAKFTVDSEPLGTIIPLEYLNPPPFNIEDLINEHKSGEVTFVKRNGAIRTMKFTEKETDAPRGHLCVVNTEDGVRSFIKNSVIILKIGGEVYRRPAAV
jgi:hypothetical protein